MSFLDGLRKVGKVFLGVAWSPVAGSIVSNLNPALGAIWNRVTQAIVQVEAAHAEAGKEHSGAEKFAFVQTDFRESLSVTTEVLHSIGKELTYDASALTEAINCQVAAFNAAKKLKDSIQIRDIGKTP